MPAALQHPSLVELLLSVLSVKKHFLSPTRLPFTFLLRREEVQFLVPAIQGWVYLMFPLQLLPCLRLVLPPPPPHHRHLLVLVVLLSRLSLLSTSYHQHQHQPFPPFSSPNISRMKNHRRLLLLRLLKRCLGVQRRSVLFKSVFSRS